ncbi:hypothetical protein MAA8898_00658 [Maliponia aquimaris]|uniref:Uncharacterized protein n=1 Tax=Maliponia aquimaris TaxID=1673631 RepID=A0A238JYU4_9RHOB|nr:hypothetical protein MAA8898_00658 [Maliponia aquimaris]
MVLAAVFLMPWVVPFLLAQMRPSRLACRQVGVPAVPQLRPAGAAQVVVKRAVIAAAVARLNAAVVRLASGTCAAVPVFADPAQHTTAAPDFGDCPQLWTAPMTSRAAPAGGDGRRFVFGVGRAEVSSARTGPTGPVAGWRNRDPPASPCRSMPLVHGTAAWDGPTAAPYRRCGAGLTCSGRLRTLAIPRGNAFGKAFKRLASRFQGPSKALCPPIPSHSARYISVISWQRVGTGGNIHAGTLPDQRPVMDRAGPKGVRLSAWRTLRFSGAAQRATRHIVARVGQRVDPQRSRRRLFHRR